MEVERRRWKAVKPLADCVVIGRAGPDVLMAQALGGQMGPEASGVLRTVVDEDGPDRDAQAAGRSAARGR